MATLSNATAISCSIRVCMPATSTVSIELCLPCATRSGRWACLTKSTNRITAKNRGHSPHTAANESKTRTSVIRLGMSETCLLHIPTKVPHSGRRVATVANRYLGHACTALYVVEVSADAACKAFRHVCCPHSSSSSSSGGGRPCANRALAYPRLLPKANCWRRDAQQRSDVRQLLSWRRQRRLSTADAGR